MFLKFNKFVKSSFELLIDEKSRITENSKCVNAIANLN